ncbi:MAG: PQQ-dependent sugar dehydrogenase [Myxococcota bacterium]
MALAAAGLALSACPGDDGSATGGGSGTSATSSNGTSTPSAATDNATSNVDTTVAAEGSGTEATATDATATDSTTTGQPMECPYTEVEGQPAVGLQEIANGFDRPVIAIGHPTEPDRIFVAEQGGTVRILEPGETSAPAGTFLDIGVSSQNFIGAEFGLLGFALHPNFPEDGRVYVNFNPPAGSAAELRTRVSEFTVDAGNPNQVDPSSERIIIDLDQPEANHNGGMIMFGADGYLYIGMGDGGGQNNQFGAARNTSVLQSKILRIDVEPDGNDDNPEACAGCAVHGPFDYTIPADNPFVGNAAFAPEIYAWGARNPWRFAQDPETGLIYMGDVGQNQIEEITLINAGADLGWDSMEGTDCFDDPGCDQSAGPNEVNADGITMPIFEYNHTQGRCSVTGLSVYRSCEVPAWDGVYFYADYCSGDMYAMVWDGTSTTDLGNVLSTNEHVVGNGWNAYGDVLVTTMVGPIGTPPQDGVLYRVAPN